MDNPSTILFVEDEPDYQMIVARTLEEAGLSVKVAGSAEEAIDILMRERPSLLLLDINLPGMDGYELCRRLRQEEYGTELPVLMLTVRRRPNEWLEGLSCGATDYLSKPFNPQDLIERVRQCLSGKPEMKLSLDVPEHRLIESAISGNRTAFEVLITQYQTAVNNSLIQKGARREEAEEIVAETFAQAFERLREFRGESSFFTWLTSIAFHNMRRKWRRPAPVSLNELTDKQQFRNLDVFDGLPGLVSDKTRDADLSHLHRAMKLIPTPYRRTLELFYLQDLSYDRIAHRLGLPPGTVMSRLSRGKAHLRRAWHKEMPPAA